MMGSIPGVIVKNFLNGDTTGCMLHRDNKKLLGGCYLFEDSASIDAYIASEVWKGAKSMSPWHNLSIEKFNIKQ